MLDLLTALNPARRPAGEERYVSREANVGGGEKPRAHEADPALRGPKEDRDRRGFDRFFLDQKPERRIAPETADKGADASSILQAFQEADRLPLWSNALSARPATDEERLWAAPEGKTFHNATGVEERLEISFARAPSARTFSRPAAVGAMILAAPTPPQNPLGGVMDLAEFELKPAPFQAHEIKSILQPAKSPVFFPAPASAWPGVQNFLGLHEETTVQIFPLADGARVDWASLRSSSDMAAQTLASVADSAKPTAPAAAQIASIIRTERTGANIDVRLEPPELGRLRIDFAVETADTVKAVLSAERGETLEHMRRHASQLIDALKDAGFSSVDLEFAEQAGGGFRDEASWSAADPEAGADAEPPTRKLVYLSLREDARLDLLV